MSIETIFPKLAAEGYRITSPASKLYNCIAWAGGADTEWWEPVTGPGYYWPKDAAREYTIESLVEVYESLGYAACADGSLEEGFTKVALYANSGDYTHAARQLDDGKWTSKLGPLEDIEHNTLESLEGDTYGKVVRFMKRPIADIEEDD